MEAGWKRRATGRLGVAAAHLSITLQWKPVPIRSHAVQYSTLPPNDPALLTQQKPGIIFPLRITEKVILQTRNEDDDDVTENRHVNLLLTEKDGDYHYSTITNFSRLVRSQVSKRKCQQFFCYRCLHGFIRQDLLDDHTELCKNVSAQRISMPSEKDNIFQFTNIH